MEQPVYVGIDCADLDLRVAYLVDGKSFSLPVPVETLGPAFAFDPHANISSLGVGFPRIRTTLGSPLALRVGNRNETPESLTRTSFARIRQHLIQLRGNAGAGTALAVPSMLDQDDRRALLECAEAAGFHPVALIDRPTAAAIAFYAAQEKPQTILVYDLGYGNFEYALIRLARDRCRVLASGTANVSGELFDATLMEMVVLALREKRIFLGLTRWDAHQWLDFRHLAATARELLNRQPDAEVSLIPAMTGLEKPVPIRVTAEQFAARVAPLVDQTVESLMEAFERTELELSDVDAFLLVGETAQTNVVVERLEKTFGKRPRLTDHLLSANGATIRAAQLARDAGAEQGLPDSSQELATSRTSPKGLRASNPANSSESLVDGAVGDRGSLPEPSGGGDANLATARSLLRQGRTDEAVHVLHAVLQEAQELLNEAMRTAPEVPSRAKALLMQANAMLRAGEFVHAVSLSHQAFHEDPNSPDVFAGMIDVHVEAALGMKEPEDYENAIHHLMCAHTHDRTNRKVHRALAERHYRHAVVMRKLKNPSRSMEIVNLALAYAPKHEGANALQQELAAAPEPVGAEAAAEETPPEG
jgi:actin-like ATPase involved in cell morphogenesis